MEKQIEKTVIIEHLEAIASNLNESIETFNSRKVENPNTPIAIDASARVEAFEAFNRCINGLIHLIKYSL